MKTIKSSFFILAVSMLAIGFTSTSCKKKVGCTDPTAENFDAEAEKACEDCCTYPVGSAQLTLNIHHKVGAANFALGAVYTDDFGHSYRFNRVQYYLSGFKVVDHSGAPIDINTYLLVSPGVSAYTLPSVDMAHLHDLYFTVGIDSVTNHADPALYSAGNPLGFQSPSTHWSWASGYIFVMLEGEVDSDGDGNFDSNFVYHIGTDNFKVNVELELHTDLVAGQMNTLSIDADYTKFLTGVNLVTESSTHTMNNMPLANKIKANIASVFSN